MTYSEKIVPVDVLAEVKSLGFSIGSYVVVGSGPMVVRGMRVARDVDIVVIPGLFEACRGSGEWEERLTPDGKLKLVRGYIELYRDVNSGSMQPQIEELIERADIIEGVPFISLADVMKFKRAYGREKDLQDIQLIQSYIRGM